MTADITDPAGIAALAETTRRLRQPVQILVNNAGLPPGFFGGSSSTLRPFAETEPDEYHHHGSDATRVTYEVLPVVSIATR